MERQGQLADKKETDLVYGQSRPMIYQAPVKFGSKWTREPIRVEGAKPPDLDEVASPPRGGFNMDFGSMYEKDLAMAHDEILRQELEKNLEDTAQTQTEHV